MIILKNEIYLNNVKLFIELLFYKQKKNNENYHKKNKKDNN
jgi:hypothetical protein